LGDIFKKKCTQRQKHRPNCENSPNLAPLQPSYQGFFRLESLESRGYATSSSRKLVFFRRDELLPFVLSIFSLSLSLSPPVALSHTQSRGARGADQNSAQKGQSEERTSRIKRTAATEK
jgi:hypothetical protein